MKSDKPHLLTPQQIVGAVLFLLLVGGLIGVGVAIEKAFNRPIDEDALTVSYEQAQSLEKSLTNLRKEPYPTYKKDTIVLHLQFFDPNTADSVVLVEVGFRPWMAHNTLRYRSKGGRYKTKESLKRIYGMTDTLYAQIEPWVVIDTTLFARPKEDTLTFTMGHLKKDTIIDLNRCDTSDLQFIRGIGPYTACQIVRYRTQLGGYASPQQLREIAIWKETMDSLLIHFTACQDSIHPLKVNKSSVRTLQRHPYLSFEQAKALYEFRRSRFRLNNVQELETLECFTKEDLERLTPYLNFER